MLSHLASVCVASCRSSWPPDARSSPDAAPDHRHLGADDERSTTSTATTTTSTTTTTTTTTTSTTTTTIGSPTGRPLLAGMPQLTDAKNVYAETGADKMAASNRRHQTAGLRAEQQQQRRHRHRPDDLPGDRPLLDRRRTPARRAVVGHDDALRQQQLRQLAHTDRSQDGQARSQHRRRRPVQPLLHARRQVRPRDGRAQQHHRRPRRQDVRGGQEGQDTVPRREPRRLLDRRLVLHRQLRVLEPAHQVRRRHARSRRGAHDRRFGAPGRHG